MTKKIPITVLTGFIGSGKTTLLHNLLKNAQDQRIAVIVNEFGDVGVDGEIIQNECNCAEGSLIELANGCICCTVQEEFLPAMQQLVERKDDIDHIVIETSGLALPKPLVRAVNWPDLKPHITVDSVITVVDAAGIATGEICDRERVQAQRLADDSLDHETPIEELFNDQLTCADLVLVTKRDLVDDDKFEEVDRAIRRKIDSKTKVVPVSHGNIDTGLLMGISAAVEDDLDARYSSHEAKHHHDHGDGHHHHHEHDHEHDDSLQSVVVEIDEPLDRIEPLLDGLKTLVGRHEIYRIKGFVHVAGKPMRKVLQGVGDRFDHYFDRKWSDDEPRKTRLVIIGSYLEQLDLDNQLRELLSESLTTGEV